MSLKWEQLTAVLTVKNWSFPSEIINRKYSLFVRLIVKQQKNSADVLTCFSSVAVCKHTLMADIIITISSLFLCFITFL